MSQKIHKLCLIKGYTEAYYQLSEEAKKKLWDQVGKAIESAGAKMEEVFLLLGRPVGLAENDKDLDDLPAEIRQEMEFHLVSNMDEVIKVALEGVPTTAATLPPDSKPAEGGTVAH